jgi:hypothetical protein
MNNSELINQIQNEFNLKPSGVITVSIRGMARLANVAENSIRNSLNKCAQQELTPLAKFLTENGFSPAQQAEWIENGIPDTAIALILEYYAYECQPRYRKEQAKALCRAFRAIGIRTFIKQQIGYPNDNPDYGDFTRDRSSLTFDQKTKAIELIQSLLEGDINKIDPRKTQVLTDYLMNVAIEGKQLPSNETPKLRGVVEIAEEMGYPEAMSLKIRGNLGKFVKASEVGNLAQKERRLVNGTMRPIYCYPDTDEVRAVIAEFFEN